MGSVYVFSNPSLHGQLKVGFTLNSIRERLSQLNSSTSIPTKFVVEYYVELEDSDTYKIEQATHAELDRAGHHHGKEFFKCTIADCKNAIARAIAIHRVIVLHAEDSEVTRGRVAREKERIQTEQARLTREVELERTLSESEQTIKDSYQVVLNRIADPGKYLHWWLAISVIIVILIAWESKSGIGGGGFVLACVAGAVVALFARGYDESDKQQSSAYLTKLRERDTEVAAVRAKPASYKLSQGVVKSSLNSNVTAKTISASAPAPQIGKTISEIANQQIETLTIAEDTVEPKQMAKVAQYVGRKNSKEVEKLTALYVLDKATGTNVTAKTISASAPAPQIGKTISEIASQQSETLTITEHAVAPEQIARVARYVGRKNSKELEKLTASYVLDKVNRPVF